MIYRDQCPEYPVALALVEGLVSATCALCGAYLATQGDYPTHEAWQHLASVDRDPAACGCGM